MSGSYRRRPPDEGDVDDLWVSVKQGGPDPTAEGSSQTVDAWYDTNVSEDTDVTCGGRRPGEHRERHRRPLPLGPVRGSGHHDGHSGC